MKIKWMWLLNWTHRNVLLLSLLLCVLFFSISKKKSSITFIYDRLCNSSKCYWSASSFRMVEFVSTNISMKSINSSSSVPILKKVSKVLQLFFKIINFRIAVKQSISHLEGTSLSLDFLSTYGPNQRIFTVYVDVVGRWVCKSSIWIYAEYADFAAQRFFFHLFLGYATVNCGEKESLF